MYELARELDMPSKDLVQAINAGKLGFSVKSHSSRLTADEVRRYANCFQGWHRQDQESQGIDFSGCKEDDEDHKENQNSAPKAKSAGKEHVAKDVCAKQKASSSASAQRRRLPNQRRILNPRSIKIRSKRRRVLKSPFLELKNSLSWL